MFVSCGEIRLREQTFATSGGGAVAADDGVPLAAFGGVGGDVLPSGAAADGALTS